MKDEYDEANALRERLEAAEANKDGAYLERNKLVALLSTLFSSGKKKTAIEGWSEDWHGCVFIDFPWGQASWHYHDSHAHLFRHLPEYAGNWNGHTTEEKYAAIDAAIGREEVAALKAKDLTKFEPDWANYRVGFDCGFAEAQEQAAKVCDGYAKAKITGAMLLAAAIRAMKECGK